MEIVWGGKGIANQWVRVPKIFTGDFLYKKNTKIMKIKVGQFKGDRSLPYLRFIIGCDSNPNL